MASAPRVWAPKETFNLIRLWKAFPCLWMKDSKDYRNKGKKEAAIKKISSTLGIDPPEIIRKSHNLRCGMNTELRKARARAAKGMMYQSPWAYYRALMFIADEIPVPVPNTEYQQTSESQDSGSGRSEDRSTDWLQITALYGNTNLEDQDVSFPSPMDLNGGLFESIAESQQYFAQADYDNTNGMMVAPNYDNSNGVDLGEDQNLPIEACAAEIHSSSSHSEEELEINPPVAATNPKSAQGNGFQEVREHQPPTRKHCPDSVPFAEQYTVFGSFVSSELKQMRSPDLRKRLKTMIQRVIVDTSKEDDTEHSLATTGTCNGAITERARFDKRSLESNVNQAPFGRFVSQRLKEIRCDERRRRLKRTIQRFMLDCGEEDDMEYAVAETARHVKEEPE